MLLFALDFRVNNNYQLLQKKSLPGNKRKLRRARFLFLVLTHDAFKDNGASANVKFGWELWKKEQHYNNCTCVWSRTLDCSSVKKP
jgi:hypothetical protein